jgi:hypothetical protein
MGQPKSGAAVCRALTECDLKKQRRNAMQWDYRNADAGNEGERELLLDMVRRHPQSRTAMH